MAKSLGVLRAVNAIAGHLTPGLSAQIASHLLLHPRAQPPRDWELAAAATALQENSKYTQLSRCLHQTTP